MDLRSILDLETQKRKRRSKQRRRKQWRRRKSCRQKQQDQGHRSECGDSEETQDLSPGLDLNQTNVISLETSTFYSTSNNALRCSDLNGEALFLSLVKSEHEGLDSNCLPQTLLYELKNFSELGAFICRQRCIYLPHEFVLMMKYSSIVTKNMRKVFCLVDWFCDVGDQLRASCILDKVTTTELHLQPS